MERQHWLTLLGKLLFVQLHFLQPDALDSGATSFALDIATVQVFDGASSALGLITGAPQVFQTALQTRDLGILVARQVGGSSDVSGHVCGRAVAYKI